MKSLIEEIKDVLTPYRTPSLVQDDTLFQLQPLIPISVYVDMCESLDETGQQEMISLIQNPNVIIFQGMIYLKVQGLNFKGRLKEILHIYNEHLKQVIGDKKALIDLYDQIPVEDIANLTEDHVVFVLKKPIKKKNKELAAIRVLDNYEIHFDNFIYQMPGCTIIVHIDSNLMLENPEVIPIKGDFYEHPFVYRDKYIFGQKICMGSFYSSKEQQIFNKFNFAAKLNSLIKQAVQILITGYNRTVTPANGHLGTPQYSKYIKRSKK